MQHLARMRLRTMQQLLTNQLLKLANVHEDSRSFAWVDAVTCRHEYESRKLLHHGCLRPCCPTQAMMLL